MRLLREPWPVCLCVRVGTCVCRVSCPLWPLRVPLVHFLKLNLNHLLLAFAIQQRCFVDVLCAGSWLLPPLQPMPKPLAVKLTHSRDRAPLTTLPPPSPPTFPYTASSPPPTHPKSKPFHNRAAEARRPRAAQMCAREHERAGGRHAPPRRRPEALRRVGRHPRTLTTA